MAAVRQAIHTRFSVVAPGLRSPLTRDVVRGRDLGSGGHSCDEFAAKAPPPLTLGWSNGAGRNSCGLNVSPKQFVSTRFHGRDWRTTKLFIAGFMQPAAEITFAHARTQAQAQDF